jgi:hypothetical protein
MEFSMRKLLLCCLALPLLALGACTGTTTPTPAQIISAGQSAAAVAGAVMTAAQAGACATQALANETTAIAVVAGSNDVAVNASKASQAAGISCTWSAAPAKPAS